MQRVKQEVLADPKAGIDRFLVALVFVASALRSEFDNHARHGLFFPHLEYPSRLTGIHPPDHHQVGRLAGPRIALFIVEEHVANDINVAPGTVVKAQGGYEVNDRQNMHFSFGQGLTIRFRIDYRRRDFWSRTGWNMKTHFWLLSRTIPRIGLDEQPGQSFFI